MLIFNGSKVVLEIILNFPPGESVPGEPQNDTSEVTPEEVTSDASPDEPDIPNITTSDEPPSHETPSLSSDPVEENLLEVFEDLSSDGAQIQVFRRGSKTRVL